MRGVEFNQLCVKFAHGRTDGAADGGGTADERRKTSAHVLISRRDGKGGVRRGEGRGKEIAHTLMIKVHEEGRAASTAHYTRAEGSSRNNLTFFFACVLLYLQSVIRKSIFVVVDVVF